MSLYRMINEYRQRYNLSPIPLSKSLSYVAALHAKDLFLHHPDQGSCNFHSWSNKGFWIPFCYPRDENKKNSVWDKPHELTRYPSKGYEIVYWENNPLVTDTIMMVWTTEEYFNSFLLNSGKWQGKPWNAIGIAVYENYVCAWFGEVPDTEGAAIVCGTVKVPTKKDSLNQIAKPVIKPSQKPPVKPKKTKAGIVLKADTLAKITDDTLRSTSVDKPAFKVETPVAKPETSLPTDSTSSKYYIIVNTTLSKENALKLVSSLKEKGYPNARLLEQDGKRRVSITESMDKAEATVKLKEIRKTYRDAWLLKN